MKLNIRNFLHIIILISGAVLFPFLAFAAKDCRIIEYPDHYEAVCDGEAANLREPPKLDDTKFVSTNGAQVSRKRQRIEDIRSLNSQRFVVPETQSTTTTVENK